MSTSHDPDTVQSVLSTSVLQLVTCLAGSFCRENIDDDDDAKENKVFIFIAIIQVVSLDGAYSSKNSNESKQYPNRHYNYINLFGAFTNMKRAMHIWKHTDV